jgi:hypothetical protein
MSRIIKVVANMVIIEAKASEASVLAFFLPSPTFFPTRGERSGGKVEAKA